MTNEVEISFPLNRLTELSRKGQGIGTAQTLLVRLHLDQTTDLPPAFCVHLDDETEANVQSHMSHYRC